MFEKNDPTNLPMMGTTAEGMSFMNRRIVNDQIAAGASLSVLDKGRSSEDPGQVTLAKPAPWYRAFDKRRSDSKP